MEKIIGYVTITHFRFNCCVKKSDEMRKTEFQIHGEGDKNEMIRLYNTLLNNGFHVSKFEHGEQTIPIIDY